MVMNGKDVEKNKKWENGKEKKRNEKETFKNFPTKFKIVWLIL